MEWQEQQKRTFLRWMQSKLKKVNGRVVNDLPDLSDGVALCQLLECLFPTAPMPRYNRDPKLAAHKMDNLAVCFKFLENADVKVLTKPQNVAESNETMVLGLLWTLVLEFDINRTMKAAAASQAVAAGQNAFNFRPGQAKDALLMWVRARVARYGMAPNNFGPDFCDGNVLLALVHSLRPDTINWPQLNRANAANNINLALATAESQMGIPALLDPQMLLGGNPDEKSVMTYVVNFLMYEQENKDLVGQLSQMTLQSQTSKQDEQRRLIEDQKKKLAELERQKALLAQKQQIQAQQEQLRQMQAQKDQMLSMQQDQMRQKMDLERKKAELLKQQQYQAELQRQNMLAQQLAAQKAQANHLAQQQAALRAQQQAAAQQLQMATELQRMKFFQQMAMQQQEGVGKRDYILFIDKSGSMAGSRWTEARKAVEALAPQITRICPQGLSMYFFNNECKRIDNIKTAKQVHDFFGREKPDRGTNLSLALGHAFDSHFSRRGAVLPQTWLIVTDGSPDRPTHCYETLKSGFQKFRQENEITVSFVQIGASQEATDYLNQLKGALQFCDSITSEELPNRDFSSMFSKK